MTAAVESRVPRPGERCAVCKRELHQAAYRVPRPESTACQPWICGWCLPTTEPQEDYAMTNPEPKPNPEVDLDYNYEPICPHCGAAYGDAWDLNLSDEEDTEVECVCRQKFEVTRHINVSYSTRPVSKREKVSTP